MPTTELTSQVEVRLKIRYHKISNLINPNKFFQKVKYNFTDSLTNGTGTGKADVLFRIRETITAEKIWNLNSIVDPYGTTKDIDAVKAIFLRNRSLDNGLFFELSPVTGAIPAFRAPFKGRIGPEKVIGTQVAKAFRFIWSDFVRGLIASESESSSVEEGNLFTITPELLDDGLDYELIILGATEESSG